MSRELADRMGAGMIQAWRDRVACFEDGEVAEHDGIATAISGLPADDQSVALVEREPADALDALEKAESRFLARGRNFGVEFERGRYPSLESAVRTVGLTLAVSEPAMAAAMTDVPPPRSPAGLELRRVRTPEDLASMVDIETEVFETERAVAERLLGPSWLTRRSGRSYLALLDGEPVASASTHVHAGALGIFGVGTREPARRRGIGTAVTEFAIDDHRDVADLAWLHASELGRPVYERMGFRVIFERQVWVRSAHSAP